MSLFDGEMSEEMRMGEYKYHKNNLIYYTNYLQLSLRDTFSYKIQRIKIKNIQFYNNALFLSFIQ